MKIHREGRAIILITILILLGINLGFYKMVSPTSLFILIPISLVFLYLIVQFFRVPKRVIAPDDGMVICPADGKVVVIEETTEEEYFQDQRIQISIFMSPLNVHVNWYPVSGVVKYFKYHAGKYLVAWHPKSSTDNERTTVVVENGRGIPILFRQIAGAVARRIVCYSKIDDVVEQSTEFGFIKFGSRVDVFLPLGSEINVKIADKVKGSQTLLAKLPEHTQNQSLNPEIVDLV